MNFRILFCLGTLLQISAFSCEPMEKENLTIPSISIRTIDSANELELKSARLVRPSINHYAPIGSIHKILTLPNRIIVLDKIVGNAVFIYDQEGNYINHIHRVGQGPGEYKNVENIFFDPNLKLLMLIPMDLGRKIYFDLEGNFVREENFETSLYYTDVVFLDDKELLINNSAMNGEGNLLLTQNGELILAAFPFVSHLDDTPLDQRNLISKISADQFSFTVGSRDTIYRINTKTSEVSTDYIFDMENTISKDEFANHPNPLKYFLENDVYVGIIDLFQTKEFLSFSTLSSNGLKGRVLSKSKRSLYDTEELFKNEVGELKFEGVLGQGLNGEFIGVITAQESGGWDFSKNLDLQKQFEQMEDVGSEEFMLLFFEIEEKS
ncbi:6-bladed beta-propeller [Algoriphagus namhaensis]